MTKKLNKDSSDPDKAVIEKVSLQSMDIAATKRAQLQALLPEVFNEGKIDYEQLKCVLGEAADEQADKGRFGLNWAGKGDCLKIIKTPSIATLKPCPDESVNFDETENLFIEGDNLEVLKLLQKSYFGKIKMIYIDPPYNTGKEFIYPDQYSESLDTYLHYTGQKDSEGRKFSTNAETEGRYHSRWLNMMYPRLYLAKNLLRDDGVIFISIDDNEQANLKKLCDEIFGEENFVGDIVWNSTKSVTSTALISVSHTHNLVYMKSKDYYVKNRHEFRLKETGEGFGNPDNDPRGSWKADPFQVGGWRPNQQYDIENPKTGKIYTPNEGCSWKNDWNKFQNLLKDNRIVFGVYGESGPQRKRFLDESMKRGKVTKTWWSDIDTTTNATVALKKIFAGSFFDNPKPIDLIKRMAELCTNKNDLILDFFAGSGTTAHAVMQLNAEDGGQRKFICVQLPEPCAAKTEAAKAGYKTIADIGKERIRRAANKIAAEQGDLIRPAGKLDLGFKVLKLAPSNFSIWDGYATHADAPTWDAYQQEKNNQASHADLVERLEKHSAYIQPASTAAAILYELLLKMGCSLTVPIETLTLAGKAVFAIDGGSLLICLDKALDQTVIDAMIKRKPLEVVCLDAGFQGNDELKVNAVQAFKSRNQQAGDKIDFRVV